MDTAKADKRSRLIDTAMKLIYERGYGRTALADIAREADVPLGNVYYYFKTKAEICEAIVAKRIAEFHAMRDQCERAELPKDRISAFIQMTVDNRAALARRGCAVGSLCAELDKEDGDLATEAGRPFRELLAWLETQFAALGRGQEKKALALHLLSALQGVSLLANTFHDPKLVLTEAEQLRKWIRTL